MLISQSFTSVEVLQQNNKLWSLLSGICSHAALLYNLRSLSEMPLIVHRSGMTNRACQNFPKMDHMTQAPENSSQSYALIMHSLYTLVILLCLLRLSKPIWGCVPSCRQRKSKAKERLITRLLVSKRRLFVKRGRELFRTVDGYKMCTCHSSYGSMKSHRSNLLCPRTEMRWKSTYHEKWLVKLQSGGFTPSVQSQCSFKDNVTYMRAAVRGSSEIKWNYPPLCLSLISRPLLQSSFSVNFCFHNALTCFCAKPCVLLCS